MRTRITGGLLGAMLAVSLATPAIARTATTVDQAAPEDGCGRAVGIRASQEYRPYEQTSMESSEPILDAGPGDSLSEMRAAGFTAPLLGEGSGLDVIRVSYRLDPGTGRGSGVVYFGHRPIERDTTLSDVLIGGGARVHETVTPGRRTAAQRIDEMRQAFELVLGPGRTTDVQVGTHPGIVFRGDEMTKGYRFYGVWFAAGREHGFTLLTGASTAEDAVDQARSLVCGRPL